MLIYFALTHGGMVGHRILLVDDELATVNFYQRQILDNTDFEVDICIDATKVIGLIKSNPHKYSVVVIDYLMPVINGAELTREILKINNHQVIAILSGDLERETIKKSFESGATAFLDKGEGASNFLISLSALCKKFEETAQILNLDSEKSTNEEIINSVGMIGKSKSLADVAQKILLYSKSSSNVVIEGETGTGKELVAKALHHLSNRKNRPFVAVNVGTIPSELFESEMFGHKKGAFTGAITDKIGKFKLAHGGTLFLDEIGDLKKDHQVKLLRVLQEGEFYPVGANQQEKVDVRIIAASHTNLEKSVKLENFRQDLFYRLNILKIMVPALRERSDDVRLLVNFYQKKYGITSKVFLMKSIKYFEAYKWPGNIRELDAEMQRLATIVQGDRVEPLHLDAKFFLEENQYGSNSQIKNYEELEGCIKNMERNLIQSVYAKVRSLKVASEVLGIGYSTLKLKVKNLNIDLEEGIYEEII